MLNDQKRYERGLCWLMAAIAALFVVSFAVMNFRGFARFGTGDIYEDVLLMQRIWNEKTLVPEGWRFSNQLYVLATPTLAAVLYGITGSVNFSCALATTIMGALCIASFIYLLRPIAGKAGIAAGVAVLTAYVYNENAANLAADTDPLVTRISDLGQLLFTTVSHYSTYFIALCLLWGWYLRRAFLHRRDRSVKLAFAVSLVLSFTTGMQSLRQLQIALLPLLGVEVLRLLAASRWFHKKPEKEDWQIAGQTLLFNLVNMAGVAVFYAITPLGGLSSVAIGQEDLKRKVIGVYAAAKSAANLRKPSQWEPGTAPLQLFYFAFAVLVALFILWALTRVPSGMGESAACCGLFTASLLLTVISMLLTSVGSVSRYLFLYWPLLAVAAAWLMERLPGKGKLALGLVITLFAGLNFWFSYKPLVTSCFDEEPLPQAQAARWLEDNGFDTVYGQFWTVGPIGLASDGAVQGGHWVFSNFYEISPYLTAEDLYTEEANETAAYVFMEQDRDRAVAAAEEAGTPLEFQTEIADTYYIYTCPEQLMHHTEDAGRDSGY